MLKKVEPKELDFNVFSAIGDQWMLITAGDKEDCNTMTASWGGLGILWGSPIAIAYIRPQRYTKEFVDREEYFTLSFFGPEYRPQLALCGSKSGRDVDKVAECGFTVATPCARSMVECCSPLCARLAQRTGKPHTCGLRSGFSRCACPREKRDFN